MLTFQFMYLVKQNLDKNIYLNICQLFYDEYHSDIKLILRCG